MAEATEQFGCVHCLTGDPSACWRSRAEHQHIADVVEESHFSVRVVACRRCGQRFVSIFCERIDWVDGNDPQYSILFPITPLEAAELIAGEIDASRLRQIGDGRPRLVMNWPSDGDRDVQKFAGGPLLIPPHD